jgi:hypothetical protein
MLNEAQLAAIEAQIDASVPYYVVPLVAEVRRLRSVLIIAQNRVMAAEGASALDGEILQEAMNVLDEGLYGRG